jgi:hypothetical protein
MRFLGLKCAHKRETKRQLERDALEVKEDADLKFIQLFGGALSSISQRANHTIARSPSHHDASGEGSSCRPLNPLSPPTFARLTIAKRSTLNDL